MDSPQTNAKATQIFDYITKELVKDSDTGKGKMFGSQGLRVGKKFFCTLTRNELVLKLPRDHVQILVKSGAGKFFDPGMGTLMKDWISLPPTTKEEWLSYAKKSRACVLELEKSKH